MHAAPLNIHGPVGQPHDQYVEPHPQYGVTTTHSGGTVPQKPVAPWHVGLSIRHSWPGGHVP